ncbi:SufS family cysteine desulfurase [Candidatus Pacearchaeota archaeon]|nr:SufS family cysteine desulfurase [Candidatus Pacearchaeota archaeon]
MKTQLMQDKKKDFPIFKYNNNLVYLDSAATSQRPQSVIDALKNFYERDNANIHRGIYTLSERATEKYNQARKKVAEFINANENEIILTKNTTESLNLLSYTLHGILPKNKTEIVLTEMEHHSNLVPWQQFAKRNNLKLKFIPITDNYELDYSHAEKIINEKTAFVSMTHVSNVFGTINDIEKIISLSHKKNALVIIDAAQSITHIPIDVKKLDADFLAFSSHKMFGPTGVGILYGKKNLLDKLPPFLFGGGMIENVSYDFSTFIQSPEKFEAGTQNYGEVIALTAAVEYIQNKSLHVISAHEKELLSYAIENLKKIKGIKIYNPGINKSISVLSFTINGGHPHDIAAILNEENIAIRAGHHCCMPLMKKLKIPGTCRVSLSIFNTKEDIDRLITSITKVKTTLQLQ